ncbi:MAG: pyridoxal phosphate-dependent aminotransferase [Marinilabiliaceae bacterium]|jgi:aspartate/methionine/tyrosine aminotransferase|nr:pyridoxal phosphate-dependent aminotransferase [Marinilabiliaceae bacterium]
MEKLPLSPELIEQRVIDIGIKDFARASIREIVKLANTLEKDSGQKFVRMEMGVPGLKAPLIGIEAEKKALDEGLASLYPSIEGLRELKTETSRFLKLFLDIDVHPKACVPTVGSMMGGIASFLVVNRNDASKEGTLFIDPGFPVQKQQVKMLGHDYRSFDVYDYRGLKLRDKLESLLETGKVSSILYSNPNNPAWFCLTEEELSIIGELAKLYDVVVIEDLAYFGMDFRKNYSVPGEAPFQPTVAKYCDDYILLVSSSKAFSYAGQRIGMLVMSDHLFNRSYPDLLRYYTSDIFGHAMIFGALYALSAGVSQSAQAGLTALLKAVNDGDYNYIADVREYGEKAKIMKKLFLDNGFKIVYDTDIDEPIADGFYFTISYPGLKDKQLLKEMLRYGISAIGLGITGSMHTEGLRACVSMVPREQFPELERRIKMFNNDHK